MQPQRDLSDGCTPMDQHTTLAQKQSVQQLPKKTPLFVSGNALSIPWGTKVTIVGFFPGVSVSADQVPPAVELKMMWNGIPNLVTLSLPTSQVVGIQYPPMFYPDINTPYQFAYPAAPPSKNASYNIWVGDYAYAAAKIFGVTVPPLWFETTYGQTKRPLVLVHVHSKHWRLDSIRLYWSDKVPTNLRRYSTARIRH